MTEVTICCIQPRIFHQKPLKNFDTIEHLVDGVVHRNVDFIVLPEYFSGGRSSNPQDQLFEDSHSFLAKLAQETQANIIGGSMRNPISQKSIFNSCFLYNREGKLFGEYRKQKLFGFELQQKIQRGNNLLLFQIDGIKFGVQICSDLWYPELSRHLARDGVQLIFVPAMSTVPEENLTSYGSWLWQNLALVRSKENIVPICVSDYALGEYHGNFSTCGASSIIDPSKRFFNSASPFENALQRIPDGSQGVLEYKFDLDAIRAYKEYRKDVGLLDF